MTQAKGLDGLVNVHCPLDKALAELVPESIRMAREIQQERIKNISLRRECFATGDGCVYNIEKGEAVLYFTDAELNPVLKQENIAAALSQIRKDGHYNVKYRDFSMIKDAADKDSGAERYLLSDLELARSDTSGNQWRFFEIGTKKYYTLNEVQRSFVKQVHGKGKQFTELMNEMSTDFITDGITETKIFFSDPKSVHEIAKNGPVARICWLSNFNLSSYFYASIRILGQENILVRGELRDR